VRSIYSDHGRSIELAFLSIAAKPGAKSVSDPRCSIFPSPPYTHQMKSGVMSLDGKMLPPLRTFSFETERLIERRLILSF
jgi:hypothetical protein